MSRRRGARSGSIQVRGAAANLSSDPQRFNSLDRTLVHTIALPEGRRQNAWQFLNVSSKRKLARTRSKIYLCLGGRSQIRCALLRER